MTDKPSYTKDTMAPTESAIQYARRMQTTREAFREAKEDLEFLRLHPALETHGMGDVIAQRIEDLEHDLIDQYDWRTP